MNVRIAKSFEKDFKRNRDASLDVRIREMIVAVQEAQSLSEIKNLKPLAGFSNSYRIRVGDYRLGIFTEGDTVIFARFLHRKEIYRYFP